MIGRNALFNLLGHAAPLVAALFFVPALVSRLDADRFGFLALAWVLLAYFSLFDLGFGRALSRLVAERGATAPQAWLRELSRTALTLVFALGCAAGWLLYVSAEFLCLRVLRLPADLQMEATGALKVLAWCVPLLTSTAALRGLLEAGHRFGWLNAIRVPVGVMLFAAPLAVSWWSTSLVALAAALALVRVAAFLAHFLICRRFNPDLMRLGRPRAFAINEMFSFGAWLTVSNVVGPLLVYLDRFALGAIVAVSVVAYYAVPYEVVTRLWIIPAALAGVLFPVMAAAGSERLSELYRTGFKAVLIAVFPVALAVVTFAPDWMHLWLGEEYALRGSRVAQLLGVGVMINCLAYLPATLLQARGHADLMAKMHLVELPVFVILLALLIPTWGAEGAALATALRCALDAAVLFVLVRTRMPGVRLRFSTAQVSAIAFVLAALVSALLPFAFFERVIYFSAALSIFAVLGWFVLLDESERARARNPVALIAGAPPR